MSESEIFETGTQQDAARVCENLADFWGCSATMDQPIVDEGWTPPSCLELLGPPPFSKSGFPFIGFLATVYDHIADEMSGGQAGSAP